MKIEHPNRASNYDVPQLDYGKWYNRIAGYGFCAYQYTIGLAFGFVGYALDDPPNHGTSIARQLIENARKGRRDIAAEKGLTPIRVRRPEAAREL